VSRNSWTPTPVQLMLLRRNLTDFFSDDELRALCSEMGVDYERLRGSGRAAKASELVRTLAAHGRIPQLVALASRLRPNVSWGDRPADLAVQPGPLRERGSRSALGRLSWILAVLIVLVSLVFVLRGRLLLGMLETAPATVPATSTPELFTSTPTVPTPALEMSPVTATPVWTPAPPTPTSLPPAPTLPPTSEQTPTVTPTPTARVGSSAPRAVTLLSPIQGICVKTLAVTFKWTGPVLRPGESFLIAITPSEVFKAHCTSNNTGGVQYSPPLMGYQWTTDLSAPPQVPAACAGSVEWTVYIRNATGNVAQAAPVQVFEWNPLRCR
jgi:hypothetical protein